MPGSSLRPRLLVAVLAALLTTPLAARPSAAQFMYLDVNHDGVCDARDVLGPEVASVDVYLVTDRNADGSTPVCGQEIEESEKAVPYEFFSYEFILRAWGEGTVTYGTWTPGPAVCDFTVDFGTRSDATDYHTGRGTMNAIPAGRYLLGTLGVTVTGHPQLSLVSSSPLGKDLLTAFGAACPGSDFDSTLKLGHDFTDACGTAPPTQGPSTTWASILKLYR